MNNSTGLEVQTGAETGMSTGAQLATVPQTSALSRRLIM